MPVAGTITEKLPNHPPQIPVHTETTLPSDLPTANRQSDVFLPGLAERAFSFSGSLTLPGFRLKKINVFIEAEHLLHVLGSIERNGDQHQVLE